MARLGDYVRIRTGKLDANASSENGQYPFFTCAVEPLKIDSYSYDCECVLVAGNGDLNVKYYNGKFDAYQRTYIIESLDKAVLSVPYLYCFLDKYVETLRQQAIGGVIKYIKLGNLTEADIPIPSIAEQENTVANINKANELISLRKEQLAKLDELVKSRFIELFGDPNLNDKGWLMGVINDIGTCVAGATPSTQVKEYWENGTIPWMSSGEVNKGRVFETDTRITQLGYDNASTKLVPPKTVVLAMAGQGRTRGTAAITEIELCTNQSICSIVNNKKVHSEYLLYFLKLQYIELRGASTNTDGRGGLNLKIIGNYPIMIPPKELQEQFAAFVEQTDKSKLAIQQSLDKLELLKKSLMQKYFG